MFFIIFFENSKYFGVFFNGFDLKFENMMLNSPLTLYSLD